MLVDNSIYKNRYIANGISTEFTIDFPFLDASHVAVYAQFGTEPETIVPASEYTITGAGNESGGVLIFNIPPVANTIIAIIRNVPITQLYAYTELDNFPAESHENALAKLTMICQELKESSDRAIKASVTSDMSAEDIMIAMEQNAVIIENTKEECLEALAEIQKADYTPRTDFEALSEEVESVSGMASETADSLTGAVDRIGSLEVDLADVSNTANTAADLASQAIAMASSAIEYKGSVATVDDLPENARAGDIYLVEATETTYISDGAGTWSTFNSISVDQTLVANSTNPVAGGAVKTAVDAKADDNNTVHKTGDETLSGVKTFSSAIVVPSEALKRNVNTSYLRLEGGTRAADGSYLDIFGQSHSSYPGWFRLYANNGSASKALIGKPDGTLTWDGKDITGDVKKADIPNPFHDFRHEYNFSQPLTDMGGDRNASGTDAPYNFSRNIQGAFVDPYAKKLVITNAHNNGWTGISFFNWDEDPRKRTFIKYFNSLWNFVDHQETCLYRPSADSSPTIICRGNLYTASGTTSPSNTLTAHVINFTYPTASSASLTWSIRKVFQMFPVADWYDASVAANKCRFCVSSDGKLMIAKAKKRSNNKWYYRIWDLPAILAQYANTPSSTASPTNIAGDYIYQFAETTIDDVNYTQGIYSDGTWIFNLYGSSNTDMEYRIRYDGIYNKRRGVWTGTHSVPEEYSSLGITKMESESIFFAPFNGKMEMLIGVTCVASNGNKYNRYLSPTVAIHSNNKSVIIQTTDSSAGFVKKDLNFAMNGTAPSNGRMTGIWHTDKNDNAIASFYNQVSASNYTFWTWNLYDNYLSGSTRRGFSIRFMSGNSGSAASFSPWASGVLTENINLGRSDHPWKNAYCATGSWAGSDERLKDNIEDIDEAVFRAWSKVNFKVFQMRDAIAEKGEEEARLHVGVIAQQVRDAFASEGLDAYRYGLFCYDEWEAERDESGRIVKPAGNVYGIRYNEALALECAYQRWRLDRLENILLNNREV